MDLYSVQFILCDQYGDYKDYSGDLFFVEICALDFDGAGKFTSTKAISMLCDFIKKHTGESLGTNLWIANMQLTEVGRDDTVWVDPKTIKPKNLVYKAYR
jgi:hypothetical protein